MQITDIRIRDIDGEAWNKLKAVASVTFDDCFVVHDIKIIEGSNGTFAAMPTRKKADGTYQDIAHPINQGTREYILGAVLDAYKGHLKELTERK